jgi:hypothetical protein
LPDAELHQRETVWIVVHVHLIKSARLGWKLRMAMLELDEWMV